MTVFRPTIRPFQLQVLRTDGVWATTGRYSTVQEADSASFELPFEARVYCDPGDVARAMYEAGVAIEGHRREAKHAIGEAVRGEALEERGQANQRSKKKPDPPTSAPFCARNSDCQCGCNAKE